MRRLLLRTSLAGTVVTTMAGPLAGQASAQSAVSIGAVGYAQYRYLLSGDGLNGNNFDVTRAYLTAAGKLTHGVGVRITTDVYGNSDGQKGVRLKYAYVTWRPERSAVGFRFGLTETPWIGWEEALWDFRMQGPVATDRNGYLTSSDYGVAVDGSWDGESVNFQAGLYNGEGYNQPPGDGHKDVSARLSVRLLASDDPGRVGGLRANGYAQLGTPSGGGRRNRYIGMVSYKSKLLTLAGELALTRDRDSLTTVTTRGRVASTFAVVRIPNTPVALIGRVDLVDPDVNLHGDRRTEFIAGLSCRVSPNLRMLIDLDNLSYQGGFPSAEAKARHSQGLYQLEFTF